MFRCTGSREACVLRARVGSRRRAGLCAPRRPLRPRPRPRPPRPGSTSASAASRAPAETCSCVRPPPTCNSGNTPSSDSSHPICSENPASELLSALSAVGIQVQVTALIQCALGIQTTPSLHQTGWEPTLRHQSLLPAVEPSFKLPPMSGARQHTSVTHAHHNTYRMTSRLATLEIGMELGGLKLKFAPEKDANDK